MGKIRVYIEHKILRKMTNNKAFRITKILTGLLFLFAGCLLSFAKFGAYSCGMKLCITYALFGFSFKMFYWGLKIEINDKMIGDNTIINYLYNLLYYPIMIVSVVGFIYLPLNVPLRDICLGGVPFYIPLLFGYVGFAIDDVRDKIFGNQPKSGEFRGHNT